MSDQKKNDHPLEDMLSQLQDALSQAVDAAGQEPPSGPAASPAAGPLHFAGKYGKLVPYYVKKR